MFTGLLLSACSNRSVEKNEVGNEAPVRTKSETLEGRIRRMYNSPNRSSMIELRSIIDEMDSKVVQTTIATAIKDKDLPIVSGYFAIMGIPGKSRIQPDLVLMAAKSSEVKVRFDVFAYLYTSKKESPEEQLAWNLVVADSDPKMEVLRKAYIRMTRDK
jgi:hypothetical protein